MSANRKTNLHDLKKDGKIVKVHSEQISSSHSIHQLTARFSLPLDMHGSHMVLVSIFNISKIKNRLKIL
jgi:hypothetical protein